MFSKKSVLIASVLIIAFATLVISLVAVGDDTAQEQNSTPVYIDSMTETRDLSPEMRDELSIPTSIRKYDVVVFDTPGIRDLLLRGKPLTIYIEGQPYTTDLQEQTTDTEARSKGIHSFVGTLCGKDTSEVVLTVSDQTLLGRIRIGDIEYFIESTGVADTQSPDKVLHYVYSSRDVVPQGPPGQLSGLYLFIINISSGDGEFMGIPANSTEADLGRFGWDVVRIDDTDLEDLPTVNRTIRTGEKNVEIPADELIVMRDRYQNKIVEYKGNYYVLSYFES